MLVGSELKGDVVVIDDVITAGTAIRESMDIISKSSANLKCVLIALDRQEKGKNDLSAIQEIENEYKTKVVSIITLNDLISFIENNEDYSQYLDIIRNYRETYGISN